MVKAQRATTLTTIATAQRATKSTMMATARGDRTTTTTTMTKIPAQQQATRATIAIAMTAKTPAHRRSTIYAFGRFEHFYQ
jgi:hypothetical protein